MRYLLLLLVLAGCCDDSKIHEAEYRAREAGHAAIQTINNIGPSCIALAECLGVRGEVVSEGESYSGSSYRCVFFTAKLNPDSTGKVVLRWYPGQATEYLSDEQRYENFMSVNFDAVVSALKVCNYKKKMAAKPSKEAATKIKTYTLPIATVTRDPKTGELKSKITKGKK